ncbi:MAG: DNA cytosine methyltransferase, partial [Bacteroides sp.]
KTPTLSSSSWENNNVLLRQNIVRRLTPTECARLQTIPDWYKWECSDTQQYKMLGNGWTVEVIKHIFSFFYF